MSRIFATAVLVIVVGSGCGRVPDLGQGADGEHSGTVLVGNARFEILSPTLIRTEYAGDGAFLDKPTFNAVGRTQFVPPTYESSISAGWLTITTSAVTLRYQVGSGPFTPQNLYLRLKAGGDEVTATPWERRMCRVNDLCEAEDMTTSGVGVATDHTGFTGSGFLAGFDAAGDEATADAYVPSTDKYRLILRYANSEGDDGLTETRTLTLSVDGQVTRTLNLAPTEGWDSWSTAAVDVPLEAGHHTVTLSRTATDSGLVNIDSVSFMAANASELPSARPLVGCRYAVSCEAEAGDITGPAVVASDHSGHTGNGFVAEMSSGSSVRLHVTDVPSDGDYTLYLRYANGPGAADGLEEARDAELSTGATKQTVSFPRTDGWEAWRSLPIPVALKAGDDDLVLACPTETSCHVNLDSYAVSSKDSSSPPQTHLPLGGYRRSFDRVNGDDGEPALTPGVLFKDGWSLLDDTQSPMYDLATNQVDTRPSHGTQSYQDGYVFSYGRNYKQGLEDLATLTGPSKLLPEWAYGVWYSEYIDRTAAEYQNDILPRFRAEGVPLDVLVIDTDFKAPGAWNGWQIDARKFPDPKAFFAWASELGLHTILNAHPSISSDDPAFAAAQATSQDKLMTSGCPSQPNNQCHVFDWGDPDQLSAYLDLHHPLDDLGNRAWWLDWCCDDSRSSLAGITPDAWVNEQYARMTEKTAGRGFVLSRAYGSLQDGPSGSASGPWADKRSTVHFTGDTYSTWGTLRDQVGWTPAESAATGLSAISHDIGGHLDTGSEPGAEVYLFDGELKQTSKLPDDLYARWVQLGTFQPVDRLHSSHGDRLPWQYGEVAKKSAVDFLNLRDRLLPYTYTVSADAARTGVPLVRSTYLEYPDEDQSYVAGGNEYFFGPNLLVAPVTTPGDTAKTTVWFPPGRWTDYFTGVTHVGPTTEEVATNLDTMPVFLKAGGIVPTRTDNVPNIVQTPLTGLTLSIAAGASGEFTLFEDDGSTEKGPSATTKIDYSESGKGHVLKVAATDGSFVGQSTDRRWTVTMFDADAPSQVSVNGAPLESSAFQWNRDARELVIQLPQHNIRDPLTLTYE